MTAAPAALQPLSASASACGDCTGPRGRWPLRPFLTACPQGACFFRVHWLSLLLDLLAWVLGAPCPRPATLRHFGAQRGLACAAAHRRFQVTDPATDETPVFPTPFWRPLAGFPPTPVCRPLSLPPASVPWPAFSSHDCIFIWVCLNLFLFFCHFMSCCNHVRLY